MADEQRVSQGGVTVAFETDQELEVSQGGVTVASERIQGLRVSQGGITVVSVPIPDPPTNLAAVATASDTITLSWDLDVMDRTALWIQRGPDGIVWSDTTVIGPDETGYPDPGLLPSTQYYYRIAAAYNGVVGAYSAAVNATTLSAASAGGILPLIALVLRRRRRSG